VPISNSPTGIRRWVETYPEVLDAVWRRFDSDGQWPEAADLTRRHVMNKPRVNFLVAAREMPAALGRPQFSRSAISNVAPGSNEAIVLTPFALSFVPAAEPVLAAFERLIQIAVSRYADPSAEPVIQSAEFEDLLGIGASRARQLEELVALDIWLFRAAGGEPGRLRIEFYDHAILQIADDPTLANYFAAQGAAWWPEPDEVRPAPAHGADDAAPDLPELSWLHPTVLGACPKLFADGHLRECVLSAAIALMDQIRELSGLGLDGSELMQVALSPVKRHIVVADLATDNGENVQRGTHLIAQGVVAAIRNPNAHRRVELSPPEALEQLAVLSFVARRLDHARVSNVEHHASKPTADGA
jgi:uncharacterized protein (TIGR02391 family)